MQNIFHLVHSIVKPHLNSEHTWENIEDVYKKYIHTGNFSKKSTAPALKHYPGSHIPEEFDRSEYAFIDVDTNDSIDVVYDYFRNAKLPFIRFVQKTLSGKLHIIAQSRTLLCDDYESEYKKIAGYVFKLIEDNCGVKWFSEYNNVCPNTHKRIADAHNVSLGQRFAFYKLPFILNLDVKDFEFPKVDYTRYFGEDKPVQKREVKQVNFEFVDVEIQSKVLPKGKFKCLKALNDDGSTLWPLYKGQRDNWKVRGIFGKYLRQFYTYEQVRAVLVKNGLTNESYLNHILSGYKSNKLSLGKDMRQEFDTFFYTHCYELEGTAQKKSKYHLYEGEYLNKYLFEIIDFIKANRCCTLLAPTGSGKTTLVNDLVYHWKNGVFGANATIKKCNCLILVPNKNQAQAKYPNTTEAVSGYFYSNTLDLKECYSMTYDQFSICERVWREYVENNEEVTIYVDEQHVLQQADYRERAIKVRDILNAFIADYDNVKIVYISATPTVEALMLPTFKVTRDTCPIIIFWHNTANCGLMEYISKGKINMIHTNCADSVYNLCVNRYREPVGLWHNKNREQFDYDTTVSKYLDKKIYVTTSLGDQAIDILNEDYFNVIIDAQSKSGEDIIQAIGRARKAKQITVHVILDANDDTNAAKLKRVQKDFNVVISDSDLGRFNPSNYNKAVRQFILENGYVTDKMNIFGCFGGVFDCGYVNADDFLKETFRLDTVADIKKAIEKHLLTVEYLPGIVEELPKIPVSEEVLSLVKHTKGGFWKIKSLLDVKKLIENEGVSKIISKFA